MMQAMMDVFNSNQDLFLKLLVEHLEISLIAIMISILIGITMGVLISEFQRSARPTLALINLLYTIPSISMLGFLIPFSGIGNATAIIALTIYALLPMVRNTHTGMTNIEPAILEAAEGMGSTRWQILYRIKLPLAMPVIISGIRNMVTMTIALAGIASFIGAGGLGVAIYRGITTNNTAMTLLGSLLIAALALVMDFILGFIEKRMGLRSEKAKQRNRILAVAGVFICIMMIVGAFCSNQDEDVIHIATKPMTEQYILGEMLDLLIEEDTELKVQLTQGVGGGTSNIQPGMESGEFDLYPEYTGTAWNMVLKHKGVYNEKLFNKLKQSYQDQLQMQWVGMYGFNNTYGLAVRRDLAEKYNLHTYSDLRAVANQLIFGAEYDFFEREDGYQALCDTYGLHFKRTMDMDIGLKYQAMAQHKIDAMVIFTTDGQLADADVVVLEDDLHFYPSYLCGNVVREDIIKKYPELVAVLEKLNHSISDEDMAKMNNEVESQGREPRNVAKDFLTSKGLMK